MSTGSLRGGNPLICDRKLVDRQLFCAICEKMCVCGAVLHGSLCQGVCTAFLARTVLSDL